MDTKHIPNLLVCQRADEDVFHHWMDDGCVKNFIDTSEEWCQEGDQPLIVIAHNFQGYDSYPIIDKLHALRMQLKQVRNRGKVLQLTCLQDSVKFIDSMSFFGMKLVNFPKTFGLTELKKGYFPHLFNTEEHQHYVGLLPEVHYHMPDNMSVEDRDTFLEWHAQLTSQDHVFDFQKELLDYCKSDVRLPEQGCLKCKKEFEVEEGFDPFEQMMIASPCNRYLRTHCLEANTIACELLLGWGGRRVNQSAAAFEWLAWEDHLINHDSTHIQHALIGGEYRPLPEPRYTVDGFDAETHTIYEFDSCFWHGCPTCFPQRHKPHPTLLGRTMNDVFRLRNKKHDLLRQHGYLVRSIWECEWIKRENAEPAIQEFLKSHQTPRLLEPQDAFFGGRINTYQLYRRVQASEKIYYYDFKSLYPFVNKYCHYPIGHPENISNPSVEDVVAKKYFGLVSCTVLPPTDLLHPVLPYRCSGKLTFPCVRPACTTTSMPPCMRKRWMTPIMGTRNKH